MSIMSLLREKWSNLKIQTKLVLTFLFTVLSVIVVITTVIVFSTRFFFVHYVSQHNDMRTTELHQYFEEYYQKNARSWGGIQRILTEQPLIQARNNKGLPAIDRMILVGPDGKVIADSEGAGGVGKAPPQLDNQTSADIHDGKKLIGKVILGVNTPPGVLSLEQRFFKSVMSAALVASLLAILLAVLLALQFSRRISVPLISLTRAAEKLAGKDFKYRLFIPAGDEIGTLATAFNSMADAIEENEQIRTRLVADVAHELRTPITIIRGSLESLQAGVMEPSQEVIISLHDEVLRLSRLINDLQEIAMAESGKLFLKLKRANPYDLLHKVVHNFKGAASVKKIEIAFTGTKTDNEIKVDCDRMIQVLSNILGNAIRHTPPSGQIKASLEEIQGFVIFCIADSGSGIDPKDLPYIFDRFYRGSKSRNRSDGGTGLGLAIARSMAELHEGRIEAYSPVHGGTVFKVYIPMAN